MSSAHLLVRIFIFLAVIGTQAAAKPSAEYYNKTALQKYIREFVGSNTTLWNGPVSLSLTGKGNEIWRADDTCGFQNCQYFVIENKYDQE